jgi:hypothetical protein
MRRGRTYYLVRWQGHASAEDSWEPVEHLAHCPERVAKYQAAAPRRPKARRAQQRGLGLPSLAAQPLPAPAPPVPAPPAPPPGWAVAAQAGPLPGPGRGAAILYWWPDEGWQLGRVLRLSRTDPLTHVVGYRSPSPAFTGDVDSLLNAASYGSRWVALIPGRTERYYRQSLQYVPGRATADISDPEQRDDFSKPFRFPSLLPEAGKLV